MKTAISIAELQSFAERLPNNPHLHDMHFAVPCHDHYWPDAMMRDYGCQPFHVNKVTFKARHTKVDGVPVTAWYYHDILVKVAV